MLAKYFSVFLISMFKFLFAPPAALALKLSFIETFFVVLSGMMFSVFIFSNFGKFIKKNFQKYFFKKRKLFTKRNRRLIRFWRKYGLLGVAFLTPPLFSPVVGTLLATSFGEKPRKILLYMFISATLWDIAIVSVVYSVGKLF